MPGLDCSKLGCSSPGIGPASRLLIAVTEKRTRAEIDGLVALLADAGSSAGKGSR
jgi:hypothetical protein